VTRAGRPVELSAREFTLLEFLMRHAGEVVTRTAILEHVCDYNYEDLSNVVDVYLGYLRRKLEQPFGRTLIRTVRGGSATRWNRHEAAGRGAARAPAGPRPAHRLVPGAAGLTLVALSGFLLLRLHADLVAGVDGSLDARAAEILLSLHGFGGGGFGPAGRAALAGLPRRESAAQLLSPDGRVRASVGAAIALRPLLGPDRLEGVRPGHQVRASVRLGPEHERFFVLDTAFDGGAVAGSWSSRPRWRGCRSRWTGCGCCSSSRSRRRWRWLAAAAGCSRARRCGQSPA